MRIRHGLSCRGSREGFGWGVHWSIELAAVFVAAVSGALAGRQKDMDFFGMYVVGLLAGVGGGSLRSVLLGDLPPAFLRKPEYLLVVAVAALIARFGGGWWSRIRRVVSLVDAVSLGLFVCVGIRVAQSHGAPWWACVACGVITATFGGVLRDVARAEVPLIFRREIYATACLVGGFVLIGLDGLRVPEAAAVAVVTLLVTGIRLLAIRYALNQSSD